MNFIGILIAGIGILFAGHRLSFEGPTTLAESRAAGSSARSSTGSSIEVASNAVCTAPAVFTLAGEQALAAGESLAAMDEWLPDEVARRASWECIARHPRGEYKATSSSRERAKSRALSKCQDENENFQPRKCWSYACRQVDR